MFEREKQLDLRKVGFPKQGFEWILQGMFCQKLQSKHLVARFAFLVAVAANERSKAGRAGLPFCSAFGAPLAPCSSHFSAGGIPIVLAIH